MRNQLGGSVVVAAALAAALAVASVRVAAQTSAYRGARTLDGKPDLNGIWQVLDSGINADLLAHSAADGIPAGQGVVEGDEIPYQPAAAAKKKENYEKRRTADPMTNCYLPGVPRVTYVPLPFEIIQTPKHIAISYAYAHTQRIIYTDGSPHVEALDFWMGDSRGRWEGDTLVVDSIDFNDRTWFDKAGDFHSDALHVVERYTPIDPDHLNYEVTIEDPKVFTRPWKMNMIIYRRLEKNLQLLDYDCVAFFWKRVLPK